MTQTEIAKGSRVTYRGATYRVVSLAVLADGTRVARIAPVGQHAGGAWVRADDCEPA